MKSRIDQNRVIRNMNVSINESYSFHHICDRIA